MNRNLLTTKVNYKMFISKSIVFIFAWRKMSLTENSLFQDCLTITKPFSPIYLKEMKNYKSLSVSCTVSQ